MEMASTKLVNIQTQAPHHFYREHQGLDSISRTFQSSELFTPFLVTQRPTVSGIRYKHYRDALERSPRVPWGMDREYGGEGPMNLPDEHRPKSEPPTDVQKGHRHYSSGTHLYPRGLPIDQYYGLTKLKKSNVRSNDELVPRPTQVDMSKLQIDREFPAEHPYSSHMSRFALFPNFVSSRGDYKAAGSEKRPLHPQMPANPHPITVVRQSKGGSGRWERQELPLDTEREPLKWPGDKFYQQRKTPTSGQQQFYPIPPKAVLPNHQPRSLDSALDPRTANALQNIERAQWQTTYNKNFTGNGTANSLRLDNLDEKEQRRGTEDHGLHTRSYNTFMPPRPLEGRISRLIGPNQMVRCVVKDGRIQYTPYVPEIDKEQDHPGRTSETHDSFSTRLEMAEWKRPQGSTYPEAHAEALSITLGGDTRKKAYDDETPKNYVKATAEKRTQELGELTGNTRWKQAELREHHHDLTLLKRKVDYTSPTMQPPVYYDSLHKIYTSKAPFYYDGDNPYEYDYVHPWDHYKTKTVLEDYKRQGEELLIRQIREGRGLSEVSKSDKYQFDGSPGTNPFVTPRGMTDARGPRVHSAPPDDQSQQPTNSSDNTNMSHLALSLPSKLQDTSSNPGMIDSTKLEHLSKANNDSSTSSPNLSSESSKPLYDPANRNPNSNPIVSSRHFNPGGSVNTRVEWASLGPRAVRSQTSLFEMQDSFTKSTAQEKFHVTFAETTPDLRDNIVTGKKHTFQGENVFVWR